MGYGREGAGADSGRTLRRDACGPDRRGHLCFVPTTEAANNQYSTSSTQHRHHTLDRVPTPRIDRQTRRCYDERGRAQDQRERSATATILLSVKVGRGTWKVGPT